MSDWPPLDVARPWAVAVRSANRETAGAPAVAASGDPAASNVRRSAEDARLAIIGVLVAAPIAIGMALESSVLTLLGAAVAFAAALISPIVGLLVLAFTAELPRPLVVPTPGFHAALIACLILGTTLQLPVKRPRFGKPSPPTLIATAFLLYVTVHVIGALVNGDSRTDTYHILQLYSQVATGLLAFLIARPILRGRSPRPLLAVILVSAGVAAAIGIAQSMGGDEVFGLLAADRPGPRVPGPFGDPNYYGTYLAVILTLILAMAVMSASIRLRLIGISLVGVVGYALLMTQSRGALVAIAAGATAILMVRSRRAGVLFVAAILISGLLLYPAFSEWRFGEDNADAGLGLAADADSSGRVGAVVASAEVIASSPVFGVGFGRFAIESATGDAAHNWYANVLAELGVIGSILWACFIVALVLALRRRPTWARSVGFGVLAAWMAGSLFLEIPMDYQASGPVFMILAAACVAEWPTRGAAPRSIATGGGQSWTRSSKPLSRGESAS
jgi:O-antigen ligase